MKLAELTLSVEVSQEQWRALDDDTLEDIVDQLEAIMDDVESVFTAEVKDTIRNHKLEVTRR